MSRLIKSVTTTSIPATPGQEATGYTPYKAARTVLEDVRTCGLSNSWVYATVGGVNYFIPQDAFYSCVTTQKYVYYPERLAVPAIPYIAPTAEQYTVWKNSGWNSYARSIGLLEVGKYIEFKVANYTRAAFVAVDIQGKEGSGYNTYDYGLMIDQSGVYVFENGVSTLLKATWTNATLFRIFRLTDGRIVYATNASAFRISSVTPNIGTPLYVYGMLYDGYDEITSSVFNTGAISVNLQVALQGTGGLSARAQSRASVSGISNLVAQAGAVGAVNGQFFGTSTLIGTAKNGSAQATFAGVSYLYGEANSGGMAAASLPQMTSLGGDYDYSTGSGTLPYFTTNAEGGFYIPPTLTEGYGQLPYFVGDAIGYDNDAATGSVTLPYFLSIGDGHSNADANYNGSGYGEGSGSLPVMYAAASSGGFIAPDAMWLVSGAAAVDTFTPAVDLVMVLNSNGTIASTFSMTREQALALMSSISGSNTFTLSGTFSLQLLSNAKVKMWL